MTIEINKKTAVIAGIGLVLIVAIGAVIMGPGEPVGLDEQMKIYAQQVNRGMHPGGQFGQPGQFGQVGQMGGFPQMDKQTAQNILGTMMQQLGTQQQRGGNLFHGNHLLGTASSWDGNSGYVALGNGEFVSMGD